MLGPVGAKLSTALALAALSMVLLRSIRPLLVLIGVDPVLVPLIVDYLKALGVTSATRTPVTQLSVHPKAPGSRSTRGRSWARTGAPRT